MINNKQEFINPISANIMLLSEKFDLAADNKDIDALNELTTNAQDIINNCNENSATKSQLYYSIANAYTTISEIKKMRQDENLLKKILYNIRKSIKLIESDENNNPKFAPFVLALKLSLYTNYASTFDICGRKIAAIEQYKKSIAINHNFGMALGNLGIAYQHYGMMENEPLHRDYLHYFAFHFLRLGETSEDPNTYWIAKQAFSNARNCYDHDYVTNVLTEKLNIPKVLIKNKKELHYRTWCLENNLFLNTLNDLPITELYFAEDNLQLPNILQTNYKTPVFHSIFTQLKQEFIYARYIYYETKTYCSSTHYADKNTCLQAPPDFSVYSIRLEKLKTSFKTLYGLFDKIAFLLAYYFDLGIDEGEINFKKIWFKNNGKKKPYKNILKPTENIALSSLFWISLDFYDSFEDTPNPELKEISVIRNSLEHRHIEIINAFDDNKDIYKNELSLCVPEEKLSSITFSLLKILREAIISLSLCVNIEEHKKQQNNEDKIIFPCNLMYFQDKWKI